MIFYPSHPPLFFCFAALTLRLSRAQGHLFGPSRVVFCLGFVGITFTFHSPRWLLPLLAIAIGSATGNRRGRGRVGALGVDYSVWMIHVQCSCTAGPLCLLGRFDVYCGVRRPNLFFPKIVAGTISTCSSCLVGCCIRRPCR